MAAQDLLCLGRPLADSIIVDNSPHSYVFQPENALPIGTFIDDPNDREARPLLPRLLPPLPCKLPAVHAHNADCMRESFLRSGQDCKALYQALHQPCNVQALSGMLRLSQQANRSLELQKGVMVSE